MPSTPPKRYAAAGAGNTNRFAIEIDEALDDASDLRMSIQTRSWTFRFALSAREDLARILSFLREHIGRLEHCEIVVGSFQDAPVRLIKDNEFSDRFWLRAHTDDSMVEFVLTADDITEFIVAVGQAVEDLQS
jgi:hypothetical protein